MKVNKATVDTAKEKKTIIKVEIIFFFKKKKP